MLLRTRRLLSRTSTSLGKIPFWTFCHIVYCACTLLFKTLRGTNLKLFFLLGIWQPSLQEMDLSTEAYLWTDPTRENAWCDAVMGGLGNRAQRYRKVCYWAHNYTMLGPGLMFHYRSHLNNLFRCWSSYWLKRPFRSTSLKFLQRILESVS